MATVRMQKFDPISNGTYPMVIDDIKEQTGKFGPCFNFIFRVSQDTGAVKAGSMATGLVSQQLTPKSKLARWLTAMGINLEVGQDFDLQQIKGKLVACDVEQNGDFSNVVEVKSIKVLEALGWKQNTPTQTAAPAQATPAQAAPVQQPVQQPTQQPAVTPVQPAQPKPGAPEEPLF